MKPSHGRRYWQDELSPRGNAAPTGTRRQPTWTQMVSCQRVEQCLGIAQVGRIEPFGEPAIDRLQKMPELSDAATTSWPF
jgi:hypothetical protein